MAVIMTENLPAVQPFDYRGHLILVLADGACHVFGRSQYRKTERPLLYSVVGPGAYRDAQRRIDASQGRRTRDRVRRAVIEA
jgi:hypothetical protein